LVDLEWRVRRRSGVRRFSEGLVVQGRRPGVLELSACRATSAETSPESFHLLGPLAAACTSEGIRRDTGIVSWLHWPNLVTIEGRAVAKTSLSVSTPPESDGKAQIVFGISVSCFADAAKPFRSGLSTISILDVLGVEIDVDLLRDKILHALSWYCAEWERGMHRKLVDRMQPTIVWVGHEVEVRTAEAEILKGRAMGLDDTGSLLLEQRGTRGSRKTRVLPPEGVELVRAVK
jgi:BirA family transcriptional regulator, biotin operon repressor / biotin---[acetyl-CoA-carboxylase] ligase